METIACIKKRRSRRKYLKKEVSDEIIEKIIDAGRHAPSSMDSQPWEFIVIRDDSVKKGLGRLKGEENEKCLLGAKVVIVVCADKEKSSSRWVEDGVCAAMNIFLAVHDLGLGAVYITGYSSTEPEITAGIRKVLGLPENIIPVVLIPIGYPDPSERIEEKKLREISELIHSDNW